MPDGRVALGGDKRYDCREFVDERRQLNMTPPVAQHTTNRRSAIDARTTRHPGYAISQRTRKSLRNISVQQRPKNWLLDN
jgi:hypothetical protein